MAKMALFSVIKWTCFHLTKTRGYPVHSQETRASDRVADLRLSLKVLNCVQVQRIDDLLNEIGPFGELRLIKKKGRLRFIEKVESFDVLEEG